MNSRDASASKKIDHSENRFLLLQFIFSFRTINIRKTSLSLQTLSYENKFFKKSKRVFVQSESKFGWQAASFRLEILVLIEFIGWKGEIKRKRKYTEKKNKNKMDVCI